MKFELYDILPKTDEILHDQGVTDSEKVAHIVIRTVQEAQEIFQSEATAIGVMKNLSIVEFNTVLYGEGNNNDSIPIEQIYTGSDHLALFAVTMGQKVSDKIEKLFGKNDFALGSLLDSTASLAVDNTVSLLTKQYHKTVQNGDEVNSDKHVLSYSPGYCGWHISGQKKLFQYLEPEQIGISLNDTYLMTPIKSVTGVLVYGNRDIHRFTPKYSFCKPCTHATCKDRMKLLAN